MKTIACDLIGRKFGRLTVVERNGSNKKGRAVWKCRCICGREKITLGKYLRQGLVNSCGCLARENRIEILRKMRALGLHRKLTHGEGIAGKLSVRFRMFHSAKHRAKRSNVHFDLVLTDLPEVMPSHCPVLGIPLERRPGDHGPWHNSPTVDRISSDDGYTKNNIRIISFRANRLKADSNSDELTAVLQDVLAIEQQEVDDFVKS